jgi:hypothetical protein
MPEGAERRSRDDRIAEIVRVHGKRLAGEVPRADHERVFSRGWIRRRRRVLSDNYISPLSDN